MGGIVARADANGVVTGTWAPTAAAARMLGRRRGIRLVTVASTTSRFRTAATELIAELRSLL